MHLRERQEAYLRLSRRPLHDPAAAYEEGDQSGYAAQHSCGARFRVEGPEV